MHALFQQETLITRRQAETSCPHRRAFPSGQQRLVARLVAVHQRQRRHVEDRPQKRDHTAHGIDIQAHALHHRKGQQTQQHRRILDLRVQFEQIHTRAIHTATRDRPMKPFLQMIEQSVLHHQALHPRRVTLRHRLQHALTHARLALLIQLDDQHLERTQQARSQRSHQAPPPLKRSLERHELHQIGKCARKEASRRRAATELHPRHVDLQRHSHHIRRRLVERQLPQQRATLQKRGGALRRIGALAEVRVRQRSEGRLPHFTTRPTKSLLLPSSQPRKDQRAQVGVDQHRRQRETLAWHIANPRRGTRQQGSRRSHHNHREKGT
mmetsp:Transcript_5224/g.15985  ORF Transcript_5224/g.15985 Transcript_5224/m.15985 type:complete len:325 (+) Transcript_5224:863-1837(+)